MAEVIGNLLENSKSLQLACIEIHNKPIFPFRYEVCVILNISAWELLLKAFIIAKYPHVKIINNDGTTKPFPECLEFTASQLGNDFVTAKENISTLYEYRCNIIHFYDDNIDVILYSLLSKNILLYCAFLLQHFGLDIANNMNLVLLPIGFKPPVSPIDFLSNESAIKQTSQSVQSFIKNIVESTQRIESQGIVDSMFYGFKMAVFNENRIPNADIVAAITKEKSKASVVVENIIEKAVWTDNPAEEGVKKVKIDEDSVFKTYYTETHEQVMRNCRKLFCNFKQNSWFNSIMRTLKEDPKYYKKRFLNVQTQSGGCKGYYSNLVYAKLSEHYKRQDEKSAKKLNYAKEEPG